MADDFHSSGIPKILREFKTLETMPYEAKALARWRRAGVIESRSLAARVYLTKAFNSQYGGAGVIDSSLLAIATRLCANMFTARSESGLIDPWSLNTTDICCLNAAALQPQNGGLIVSAPPYATGTFGSGRAGILREVQARISLGRAQQEFVEAMRRSLTQNLPEKRLALVDYWMDYLMEQPNTLSNLLTDPVPLLSPRLWLPKLVNIFVNGVILGVYILATLQDALQRSRAGVLQQLIYSTIIKAIHKPLQVIPKTIRPIDAAA